MIRKDVSRSATVASVKNVIKTEYDADKANVKAVFLFGHVPVPRSGNINPDGHGNHVGAWAADTYYGDMDGVWTDTTVRNTSAERADNHNVPGDGRFDQGTIPSDLELAVGRVDLSNMTCFSNKTPSRSELDLLRAYLEKDHKFRHGKIVVPRRGLIADNFGDIYGEAFAAAAWRSFAPMFTQSNLTPAYNGQYFPTLSSEGYLFTYACGGGSYYTCAGVGGSDDFALNDIKAVFTMHFGSYFGDWDNESNFLRASLGSGYVLTTSWSGRPHWFYHRMALGEPIGNSARLSMNNNGTYQNVNQGGRGVNNVLLGDPTLRLHPVLPPSNLTATAGSGLKLSWTGSSDTAIKGYHVYRAATAAGPFTRLNATLVGATSFTDTAPLANGVYMVRAVKLESSASGTYYNPSQGVFYTNGVSNPTPDPTPTPTNTIRFVKSDTTTLGNWKGVYGSEGSWIVAGSTSLPSYATVTTTAPQWVWQRDWPSVVAPYISNTSTSRIAACWYSASEGNFDISIKDGKSHLVSMYFWDASGSGRVQRVELIDRATGAVVDSRTLSNFKLGIYLTWEIAGDVTIRMTPSAVNAVASAIFFDAGTTPSPAPAPTTSARFVKSDTTTRGNWKGVYGAQGNWIYSASPMLPSYATVTPVMASEWIWNYSADRDPALYLPTSTSRVAACWYSFSPFNMDFAMNDTTTHRISGYFLDWDNAGRQQRVDVIDATSGVTLDSRTISNFSSGIYLAWDVVGNVRLRVTPIAGNAVVSGVFFDGAN